MVETKCSSCPWIVSVFASHQYCFCVAKICGHCAHIKHKKSKKCWESLLRLSKLGTYCCDRKSLAAYAQSFALWQQATVEFTCHDHSIIACSRHLMYGVVLHAHSVRGESHIQRNTTGEVATTFPPFYNEPHRSHFFLWRLHLARPSHPGHSTILSRSESPSGMCAKLDIVAASNNRDHAPQSLFKYACHYVQSFRR